MFTQGGIGRIISGKVVVISRDKITIDGKEISREDADRLKEDSKQKLLTLMSQRQAQRIQEEKNKAEKERISQKSGKGKKQNSDNVHKKS